MRRKIDQYLHDWKQRGNYDPKSYKLYYKDIGLLVASLDEEAQEDMRVNKNYGTYKGAIYENVVGDMLVKQGYDLYSLVSRLTETLVNVHS